MNIKLLKLSLHCTHGRPIRRVRRIGVPGTWKCCVTP